MILLSGQLFSALSWCKHLLRSHLPSPSRPWMSEKPLWKNENYGTQLIKQKPFNISHNAVSLEPCPAHKPPLRLANPLFDARPWLSWLRRRMEVWWTTGEATIIPSHYMGYSSMSWKESYCVSLFCPLICFFRLVFPFLSSGQVVYSFIFGL